LIICGWLAQKERGAPRARARTGHHAVLPKHANDMAYQVGDVYAWRGEKDRAFEWLERAYQQRDSGLNGIAYDSLLAGLKSDPRYGALLQKLNLTD
jgi:serine/threonine-protein kinase